jgi:GcrA cell cycle regulator
LEKQMSLNSKGVEWTAQMIKRFRELVDDKNLSYRTIASTMTTEFNVVFTKNACIGKGRRLGVDVRVAGFNKSKKRKPVVKRKYIRVDAPIAPVIPVPARDPEAGITIYELREGDCKWPLGKTQDYPPYMFCGYPAIFGCPWCKKHRKIAYPKLAA